MRRGVLAACDLHGPALIAFPRKGEGSDHFRDYQSWLMTLARYQFEAAEPDQIG